MEDSQHLCPDCGADYVGAVVDDIASGAGADSRLMLASLEEGLAGLDAVPLPALGDTARKMLPALCAAALVFCLLAGVATGANIFYLLAAVALVPLVVSLLARMQGKLRLSAGEVVVRAARGSLPRMPLPCGSGLPEMPRCWPGSMPCSCGWMTPLHGRRRRMRKTAAR